MIVMQKRERESEEREERVRMMSVFFFFFFFLFLMFYSRDGIEMVLYMHARRYDRTKVGTNIMRASCPKQHLSHVPLVDACAIFQLGQGCPKEINVPLQEGLNVSLGTTANPSNRTRSLALGPASIGAGLSISTPTSGSIEARP